MFRTNSIVVTNLNLVAALLTVGAKMGEQPVNVRSDHAEKLTFFFEDNKDLEQYIRIWKDEEYRRQEAEKGNQFAFITEAFNMKDSILNNIKSFKKVAILQRNGKTAVISEDCPDDLKKNILARLN